MIYGVGIDMVSIDRMKTILDKYGDKFDRRILGKQEFDDWLTRVKDIPTDMMKAAKLAKYWAAKEATSKAFGTGFARNIGWRNICLDYDQYGKPSIYFTGKVKAWANEQLIMRSHVSFSDEQGMVVAIVILEK